MRIKLSNLDLALEYVSSGSGNETVLRRDSGELLLHSEFGDNFDEWPDDVHDEDKYLAIPDKRELDLGQPLVFAFVRDILPEDCDEVRRIFDRRGAYARFKDLPIRSRALDRWYAFENEATKRALREWCEANGVTIEPEDSATGAGK